MTAITIDPDGFVTKEPPFEVGETVLSTICRIGETPKEVTILDIWQVEDHCESGWMVKITDYPNPVDSNWCRKLNKT